MIYKIINDLLKTNKALTVSIDGKCGSGKTTLAEHLKKRFSCNVIHMDDFFLRDEQRTPARLNEPGGNIDYERFIDEVLVPLSKGIPFSYKPYNCAEHSFDSAISISPGILTVIEGSYSCHPNFFEYSDLHIFIDVCHEIQIKRIEKRNGIESAKKFKSLWIPLEEKYFSTFDIKNRCEIKAQSALDGTLSFNIQE